MGEKIHCTLQGRNVDFLKYVSSNHASEKKRKKNALTNFALTETYIALKIYVEDSMDIEIARKAKFFYVDEIT